MATSWSSSPRAREAAAQLVPVATGHEPRVSIGLPVYNGERYLSEALDALLAQTFKDFELIVCDNASSDHTSDIARQYAAQDDRIRYVRHEVNVGAARNYNRAFRLSRGEYFKWAAADDRVAPTTLARCVEVLDRDPSVVVAYPRTTLIDEWGRMIRSYEDGLHLPFPSASVRFRQLLERLGLCNALYGVLRTTALRRTALLGVYPGSDIVLQAELSLYGTFWEVPEPLFFRRMHLGASSAMSEAERAVFYDPRPGHRVMLREWRHVWELGRAVVRAPLGVREKGRLGVYLLRRVVWLRDRLIGEVAGAARQLVHVPGARRGSTRA